MKFAPVGDLSASSSMYVPSPDEVGNIADYHACVAYL